MTTDPGKSPEDENKIRETLRRLPKLKAPWYFEARLRQKLGGKKSPLLAWIVARPLPSLATGLAVFFVALIAGYYTWIVPQVNEQADGGKGLINAPLDSVHPHIDVPPSPPPQQILDESHGRPGPSPPGLEAVVESGVRSREASSNESLSVSPVQIGPSGVVEPNLGVDLPGKQATTAGKYVMGLDSLERKKDSLKKAADSLRK